MTKLAQLKPSFSELDREARLALILTIRASRRISKRPPPAERKPRAASTTSRKKSVTLTPELAAELLALLGEEGASE